MKITKGTIVRTVMVGAVLLNMGLKAAGHNIINVSESEVVAFVEAAVEIGVVITGFWYNNSFTEKAKLADEYMKNLNKGE